MRGILIRIRNRRKTSRRKIKSSGSGDEEIGEVDKSAETSLSPDESVKKEEVIVEDSEENTEECATAEQQPEDVSAEEDMMSEEEKQFVMPGDFVGTTEEFKAGNGTYVDVSDIFSIGTGYVQIDRKSRVISVVPKTSTPPELCEGDIVIGGITNLRDSVVLVDIGGIKGKGEREFQMNGPAAIHVSNVRDSYVKNLGQEFALSDVVKAKVINTQNMRLSTSEKSLGVMKAYCSRCRTVLEMDGNRLKCPACGRTEKRKISSDYGTGIV
ncbi:exosome complex RNA-binding protein Csl4 [Methanolobus sp. ZRKC2]|uniref:exosome complex RNA-binding protein Csl4 n=1 Tax=Methanolobus sp. ZRKC2 TaxID=3125783 RepID=UPI0032539CBF